ncbi:hypothetical protein Mapa_009437 [Marchantia paleacea]|nr:hypothetical protein Mapa_009437 [Marchantia paleacea]
MQSRLLLDVIISQSPPILELLAGENQPLLVGRNPLLVLNLGLYIIDRIRAFDLESDGLASQCLHKDLHPGDANRAPSGTVVHLLSTSEFGKRTT